MYVQKLGHADHVKLLEEVQSLITQLGIKKYEQISLQSPVENANPLKWWKEGTHDRISYPGQSYVHPLFREAQLINYYMNKFQMFRTRIMKMEYKSCLSYHHDNQKRIHFPLTTNNKCFMVVGNKVHWLGLGRIYLVDTTKMHTAVNGNPEPFTRIHIVGCVKE